MTIECRCRISKGEFNLDLELHLAQRGIIAITGPSGSGKTTFLRFLAGLDSSADCRLKVNDNIWQDESYILPTHKRAVGYVFQQSGLFHHLSVRGNIDYARKRSPESADEPGDLLALLGIEHLLDRSVDKLSGGERQRVAIARALASCPELLLLDEPLASLDSRHQANILPFLESLHRQLSIPVIYVSHSLDEIISLADHLLILEKGRLRDQGELHTVLSANTDDHDRAVSVIDAEITALDREYQLIRVAFAGGEILALDDSTVRKSNRIRLIVDASDITLALDQQPMSSLLNQIPARIERIDVKDSSALVTLAAGATPLLSRITKKSVDQLDLQVGSQVFARIEASALRYISTESG